MDLRAYYEKIRMIEATITDTFTLVFSAQTNDGGRPGTVTEVPRRLAAKMVVDGTARLATETEAREFREEQAEAVRTAEQKEAAQKLHLTVISSGELNRLREEARSSKD